MRDMITLEERPAQPILSIRLRTNLESLPQVIGQSYQKIVDYMSQQGQQPFEAPFTAYYNLDMQDLDVEMGFPVAKPLPASGDIQAGEIAAGKAAVYLYKGPYANMESTYNAMFQWIAEHGGEPTGVYYEYYYNCPADTPAEELLTKIVIPLK